MKRSYFFTALAILMLIAGCGGQTPEEQAAQADADMKQRRMELADQYQQCTQKATAYEQAKKKGEGDKVKAEDQVMMSQCEEIMRTMEALK